MATETARTTKRSQAMFERIKGSIAGGESSYARLRAGIELCVDRTAGARMWDVDDNEYIDYCFHPGIVERWFISTEHTEADIDATIAATEECMRAVARRYPPTMATAPHAGSALSAEAVMPE